MEPLLAQQASSGRLIQTPAPGEDHQPDADLSRPFEAEVEELEKSIAFFCPIFVFDTEERYFPCDVEYYFSNSTLYFGKHKVADDVNLETFANEQSLAASCEAALQVPPTASELLVPVRPKPTLNLRLKNEEARIGFGPKHVDQAPVYVVFNEFVDYDEIVYCTFCSLCSVLRLRTHRSRQMRSMDRMMYAAPRWAITTPTGSM